MILGRAGPSGEDSKLPLQGTTVSSFVGEVFTSYEVQPKQIYIYIMIYKMMV